MKKIKSVTSIFFYFLFFINVFSLHSQEKPRVAIVNLHVPRNLNTSLNPTLNPADDSLYQTSLGSTEVMVGILTTFVVNSKKFRVVERSRIDQIIREQGFQKSQLSEAQVIRIGRILGVHKIITGEFDIYTLNIRLIDVETGDIEAAVSISRGTGPKYIDTEEFARKAIDQLLM